MGELGKRHRGPEKVDAKVRSLVSGIVEQSREDRVPILDCLYKIAPDCASTIALFLGRHIHFARSQSVGVEIGHPNHVTELFAKGAVFIGRPKVPVLVGDGLDKRPSHSAGIVPTAEKGGDFRSLVHVQFLEQKRFEKSQTRLTS